MIAGRKNDYPERNRFVDSLPSAVNSIFLSDLRGPLGPARGLALFRKSQPLIHLPHRLDIPLAVLDDLGDFAGTVVGIDFGAVEFFFWRRDVEGFR